MKNLASVDTLLFVVFFVVVVAVVGSVNGPSLGEFVH